MLWDAARTAPGGSWSPVVVGANLSVVLVNITVVVAMACTGRLLQPIVSTWLLASCVGFLVSDVASLGTVELWAVTILLADALLVFEASSLATTREEGGSLSLCIGLCRNV